MRILILGAGGIGGYFGGRLAHAGGDVTFLVRDARKAVLDRVGITIESTLGNSSGPVRSIVARDLTPDYDCVLVTCKSYDLDDAMETIAPAIAGATFILPELNGIAHIERLNARFGRDRVLGGTARIAVTLTPEGVIRHLNDWHYLTFGEQDGTMSDRVQRLAATFNGAGGVDAKAVPNVMQEMWEKVVHLSTAASMTCLMRAPVGDIVRAPHGAALFQLQLETAASIARANGHPPGEAFLASYRKLFGQTDSTYGTSMLRDMERKGPIEADHIIGFMVDQAERAGLDATLFRIAYTHLKAYENRRAAGRL